MLQVSRDPRRERIGCLNWPDAFPYAPEASFEIAHSGAELHLTFRVEEQAVRAVCAADGGRAWEDSCVEFFFAPRPEDGVYYNLECTCIGKVLLCRGTGRHGREPLPEALLQGIRRTGTLGVGGPAGHPGHDLRPGAFRRPAGPGQFLQVRRQAAGAALPELGARRHAPPGFPPAGVF